MSLAGDAARPPAAPPAVGLSFEVFAGGYFARARCSWIRRQLAKGHACSRRHADRWRSVLTASGQRVAVAEQYAPLVEIRRLAVEDRSSSCRWRIGPETRPSTSCPPS